MLQALAELRYARLNLRCQECVKLQALNVAEARHCTLSPSSRHPRQPNLRWPQAKGTHITEVCRDVVGPQDVCMAQPLAQPGPQQMATLQRSCAVPIHTVQDLRGLQRLKASSKARAAMQQQASQAAELFCAGRGNSASAGQKRLAGRLCALPASKLGLLSHD